MKNRTLLLFSLAACAGLFSGILVVHASDHEAPDVGLESLMPDAVYGHQMHFKLVNEMTEQLRADFAIHDGRGEIVTGLALDADPAPIFIQRRASVIIPARRLNTNWIHAYTRSREHGHEITTAIHYPAHSRLPAGGYA